MKERKETSEKNHIDVSASTRDVCYVLMHMRACVNICSESNRGFDGVNFCCKLVVDA